LTVITGIEEKLERILVNGREREKIWEGNRKIKNDENSPMEGNWIYKRKSAYKEEKNTHIHTYIYIHI
jgi:hypothetical protein